MTSAPGLTRDLTLIQMTDGTGKACWGNCTGRVVCRYSNERDETPPEFPLMVAAQRLIQALEMEGTYL